MSLKVYLEQKELKTGLLWTIYFENMELVVFLYNIKLEYKIYIKI